MMAKNFETFAALHVPGDPLILYNIWDPGSAGAVAAAGAKAIATGSHPVGDSSGFGDAQQVPIEFVFDEPNDVTSEPAAFTFSSRRRSVGRGV